MDPYTEQLLERTRQRRAMLNQKLGKTPDPAPRKRVLEDTTNMPVNTTAADDDSPKRQCNWDEGKKADTPAIPSVKSRLHALSNERMNWSDTKSAENEVPQQPVFEGQRSPASSPVNRKSRFAKLAQNLDDFECDMSHPTIKKPEEKKPRWQPPQGNSGNNQPHSDARDRHVSSPKKEYELYQGPKRTNNSRGTSPAPSPKKKEAPAPPVAPPVPHTITGPPKPPRAPSPEEAGSPKRRPAPSAPTGSPKVSTHTIQLQQPQSMGSPKYTHQVRTVTSQVPVNRKQEDQGTSGDEPTSKPVTERLASWKKNVEMPNKGTAVSDPTELPLSERFAGWEQRVSQTPKGDRFPAGRVTATPKQTFTPARETRNEQDSSDPAIKPVSDIRASWKQQDAKNNPPKESEPTAFSVTERMSAWETMTSSNQVSYIKKVDPGSPNHSPTRAAGYPRPVGTPSKGATWKPSGTPNKGLTPQKSFKDSIQERAAQMGRKPSGNEGLPPRPPTSNRSPVKSPSKANQSPGRTNQSPVRTNQSSPNKAGSPTTKVGSATKSLQQKILEQVQYSKTDQVADKLRQERMAEVNALNNRYQNGILKDDRELPPPTVEQTCPPPPQNFTHPVNRAADKKTSIREKVREDFNKKLQAMGFELSDEGSASYNFKKGNNQALGGQNQPQQQTASTSHKPSSIYRLVSKKCTDDERPVVRQQSSSSLKKVKFQEHNTSTESDSSCDRQMELCPDTEGDTMDETDDFDPPSEDIQSETQESFDDSYNSGSESSIPESYKSPSKKVQSPRKPHPQPRNGNLTEDDDISMSAFVPDSVRRESVLPQRHDDTCSITSEDSMDFVSSNKSDVNTQDYSSQESVEFKETRRKGRLDSSEDSEDEECDRAEMDDLLDEAMDDISEVEMRRKEPHPTPRKRRSYMNATTEGELNPPEKVQMRPKTMPPQGSDNEVQYRAKSDGLAYSVSMYRSNRMSQEIPTSSQRITRNSHYVHEDVKEEDIKMPSQLPPEVQRKTLQERVKELQELVSQEQSVIMQTSNALNKCCSGDSQFAGSAEQVECNRLLLVSCQKRQAYLTEIQRLKETKQLEPVSQEGPKGSLTISDIRLPLKKDFVTKIGTSSDNTTHYFILLIRNGPQVITTQMLSTHDPMMRGSLDFPNLIKIHGISSHFNINLEIYSMSVSRENKDKKKKTPKKGKHMSHIAMESPGGPTAVRTTSFTLITSLPITMKSLDKSSFALERIPFLSPLHGMIYMRLKCMMEQNVEERGFLTMFEDVSGLGAWHRRWVVLTGNKLCYWKYPDDETRKDPMGIIDLKRVITEKIGLIPRDICARPHTFELVSVRPPRKGEQDTLVTKTYNTMTTTRFMLSADTKEERIVWCNKINRALANLRTWHADAMRPIKVPK